MIKRLVFLGVFALAAGATVRVLTAPAPASAIPAISVNPAEFAEPLLSVSDKTTPTNGEGGRLYWQSVWTRPAPKLQNVSLAGDGQTLAWVDDKGSVRRVLAATGATLWQSPPLPGINRVLAIPGENGCVLAYGYLNAIKPTLRLLDAKTGVAQARTFTVDGAVWNAQAAPDGKNVVIATGKSFLYVLPVSAPPPLVVPSVKSVKGAKIPPARRVVLPPVVPIVSVPPVRIRVQGIADDMDIARRDPVTVAATWQAAGVCAWGLDGTPKWRHDDAEADRTYQVHLSADGSTAVATSTKGPDHTKARLHVWDARTGHLLWSAHLEASEPKALVSANGQTIAVTFAHSENGAIDERKLALFDRTGRRRFADKGGIFFAPELVALSDDGTRLTVRDKSGYLHTMDERGRMVGRVRLAPNPGTSTPPTIQQTQTSRDGKTLLLLRGDGQMTLFRATP